MNADSGATYKDITEVERNDLLADEVEKFSKWQGWAVGSTNEKDSHTSLSERVSDAKAFGAELFISIHHDWTGGEQAVIYSNTNDIREIKARRLSGFINRQINKSNDKIPNGGIYADRRGLTVLKGSMPAVIIEASRIQDKYFIENMARWIVQGICNYKGVIFRDKPKPITNPKPKPPTLKFGSKGTWVGKLQSALNSKGAKLKRDEHFGSLTLNAVRNFQKSKGLVVDGIVGPKTWAKLGY
jgi:hypothetical protein